jgi:hypothetical protein
MKIKDIFRKKELEKRLEELQAKDNLYGLIRELANNEYRRLNVNLDPRFRLGLMGERAIGPLIEALADEDREVVFNAILLLRSIGDVRAVEPLRTLAKSDDEGIRNEAVNTLKVLEDDSSLFGTIIHKPGDVCVNSGQYLIVYTSPYLMRTFEKNIGMVSGLLFPPFGRKGYDFLMGYIYIAPRNDVE